MGLVDLKKLLPKSLQTEMFWNDLMDTLKDELELLKTEEYNKLLYLYDLKNNTDKDLLKQVALGYGYQIDNSLFDSLDYVQTDTESIGFRKRFKTTYLGYEYDYKSAEYDGDVSILYYDGEKLIRAIDSQTFTILANVIDFTKPSKFYGERNYYQFFSGDLAYDSGFTYDEVGLQYDLSFNKVSTKHITVEYFPEKLITNNSVEYTMTNEYLDYLSFGTNQNRRIIETPHNGVQLTFLMDESGFVDNLIPTSGQYSYPDMKFSQSTIFGNFPTPLINITTLKVGTGVQSIPSKDDVSPSWPTDIASPLFKIGLRPDEKYSDTILTSIQTILQIEYMKDEIVSATQATSFVATLSQETTIQKFGFELVYTIGGKQLIATDDGNGNIVGDHIISGTINYSTSVIDITFDVQTDVGITINANYKYNSIGDELKQGESFTTTQITEAGLFNDSGELVAYATFPPVEYNDNKYHISFQFVIYEVEDVILDGGSATVNPIDEMDGGSATVNPSGEIDGGNSST